MENISINWQTNTNIIAMKFVIDNVKELKKVAQWLTDNSGDIKVWFFKGDLGAGKTTLIQEICRLKGVEGNVVSPSFALVNVYDSKEGDIYHIDLYRLENTEEALDLGIEDYLYSGNYCFIEWPGIIEGIAPEEYMEINMEILPGSGRSINIVKRKND